MPVSQKWLLVGWEFFQEGKLDLQHHNVSIFCYRITPCAWSQQLQQWLRNLLPNLPSAGPHGLAASATALGCLWEWELAGPCSWLKRFTQNKVEMCLKPCSLSGLAPPQAIAFSSFTAHRSLSWIHHLQDSMRFFQQKLSPSQKSPHHIPSLGAVTTASLHPLKGIVCKCLSILYQHMFSFSVTWTHLEGFGQGSQDCSFR